jgi:hypothetical protein
MRQPVRGMVRLKEGRLNTCSHSLHGAQGAALLKSAPLATRGAVTS